MSDIHEQIYKQWMANSYRQTLKNGIWECTRGPSKLRGEPKEILHLFCFCCDYVGSGRAGLAVLSFIERSAQNA